MLNDRYVQWLQGRLEDLDYGDIDGIEAAVREFPLEGVKKDGAEKEPGYLLKQRPRMRYHWFRSRGLFTGSAVVEAGCKTVVGQRLKQAGMHWTTGGADAIIALRCREASSQWEAICNAPHTRARWVGAERLNWQPGRGPVPRLLTLSMPIARSHRPAAEPSGLAMT